MITHRRPFPFLFQSSFSNPLFPLLFSHLLIERPFDLPDNADALLVARSLAADRADLVRRRASERRGPGLGTVRGDQRRLPSRDRLDLR